MTNDESPSPRDTLGQVLRRAREGRGLSLEQVSSSTKIHVKIIQDLELDRYDELPAEPFTRGFIYNYARFLGLPPHTLFEDYKNFLEEKWKRVRARSPGVTGYAFERPEGEQSRRLLWAIMIGMFVLGMLVIIIFKPSLKHRKHGHIEQLRAEGGPSPSPSPMVSGLPMAGALTGVAAGKPIPSASPSPTVSPAGIVAAAVTPKPSATPSASPTVTATATPTPSPSISVTATPTVSVSPSPSPKASTIAIAPTVANRADQLQNGSDYEPADVKQKLVLKALADVVVQYRCDDKTIMKFTLRKDRILVLRGKVVVRLQVSNPNSIALSQGSKGYVPLSETKRMFAFNGASSLIQPADQRSKMGEQWDGATGLVATPDPAPDAGSGTGDDAVPTLSPTP